MGTACTAVPVAGSVKSRLNLCTGGIGHPRPYHHRHHHHHPFCLSALKGNDTLCPGFFRDIYFTSPSISLFNRSKCETDGALRRRSVDPPWLPGTPNGFVRVLYCRAQASGRLPSIPTRHGCKITEGPGHPCSYITVKLLA